MKAVFKLPALALFALFVSLAAQAQTGGASQGNITLEGGLTLHQYNADSLSSQMQANGIPGFSNSMMMLQRIGLVLFLPASGEKDLYVEVNYSGGKMNGGVDSIFTTSMRMSQFRVGVNYPFISNEDNMLSGGLAFGSSVYRINIEQSMTPLQTFDAAVTNLNGLRNITSSNTFHLVPQVKYLYFLSKGSPRIAISAHAGYRISTGTAVWKSFGRSLSNSPPVDKGGVEGGISLLFF